MAGGGSSSGTIQVPTFMEGYQRALMHTATTESPTTYVGFLSKYATHTSNWLSPTGGHPVMNDTFTDPTTQWNNAIGRFCLYNTLINNLNPVTDRGTHLTGAVSQVDATGVLRDIDVSGLSAASRSEAEAAIGDAYAGIPTGVGIDPFTLFPQIMSGVIGAVDASGVLRNIDVDTIIADAKTAAEAAVTGAVGAMIEQIDPETDWQSYVTKAISGMSGVIMPIDISSLQPITESESAIDALVAKLTTPVDEEQDYKDALSSAVTAIGATGVLSNIDVSGVITKARDGATLSLIEALDNIGTDIAETTDWNTYITAIVAKIDQTGVLRNVDVDNIITISEQISQADMQQALDDVLTAISNADVSGAVTEYTNSQAYARNKAMRRFAGIMSEINAVQGSAFLLGMALIEAESLQNIAQYDKDLRLGLFRDMITGRLALYKDNVQYSIQAAIEDKRSRDQLMLASLNNITEMLRLKVAYEQAQLATHSQAMTAQAQIELNAAQIDKAARDQLLRESMQFQSNMIQTRVGLDQALVSVFSNFYQSYLRENVQVEMHNKSEYNRAIQSSVQQMMSMLFTELDFQKAFTNLYIQSHNALSELKLRGESIEVETRARLIENGVRSILDMLFNREAFKTRLLDIFNDVYRTNSQIELQARLANKSARDNLIADSVSAMGTMLQNKVQFDGDAVRLITEQTRMATVSRAEYEAAEMDRKTNVAMWGFDLLQIGANILSAGHGSSAMIPVRPSRGSQVLGGALSGAGAGAAIGSIVPGIGTALGAGLGALLGGAGGAMR